MRVALIAFVLALAPSCASAAEPGIQWRLQDRFRLFDRGDEQARGRVERVLTTLSTNQEGSAEGALRPHYDLLLDTLSGGDAASLRSSNWVQARTTDNIQLRRYAEGYLYPSHYKIEAWSSEVQSGTCRWSVDGLLQQVARCSESVTLDLRGGRFGDDWGGQGIVTVEPSNGAQASLNVAIDDKLVVAMGDSFISGEGNPDVPSRISPGIPPQWGFERPDWLGSRDADAYVTRAEWWDEPCHRSLLSWPVLASLYLASRDERSAVTLVHVGCSGAEEDDGLNEPQKDLPGGGDEPYAQADQVRALIAQGPGRSIDHVLLSLGGNDAGFVPVISYAVLPPNGYGLGPLDVLPATAVGAVGNAIPPYEQDTLPLRVFGFWRESAQSRLAKLPTALNNVARTFADLGVQPDQVTHVKYPDLLHDSAGDYCRTVLTEVDLENEDDPIRRSREQAYRDRPGNALDERGGFEALLYQLPAAVKWRTDWNFQFHYEPERDTPAASNTGLEGCDTRTTAGDESEVCKAHWVWMRLNSVVGESDQQLPEGRGWRVADAHVNDSSRHGWCVSPSDSLQMPVSVRTETGWAWFPEHPSTFQPYREDLGRWFRTANDSVRTQYADRNRMHGGTIHPTYNMHIAYAESVFDTAFRPQSTAR